MIFIPIPDTDFDTQCDMMDWAIHHIGKAAPDTWFWARHEMTAGSYYDTVDFTPVRCAIVFAQEKDAVAFKLKYEV